MTIYASPYGGRRYHASQGCTGLNSTDMANIRALSTPEITRAEAVRRGLTPCAICNPSPLLTALPGGSADG